MNAEAREKLSSTVFGVLERFTFMFAETPEEEPGEWDGEYLHSAITFEGPEKGVISITAPSPLCKEIAANVLGELDSDDILQETAADAVKELLNIICGELVAELYGTKVVVNLSVPSFEITDKGKWQELAGDADVIKVLVEDQPMIVNMVMDGE